jgi:hypothetical protein
MYLGPAIHVCWFGCAMSLYLLHQTVQASHHHPGSKSRQPGTWLGREVQVVPSPTSTGPSAPPAPNPGWYTTPVPDYGYGYGDAAASTAGAVPTMPLGPVRWDGTSPRPGSRASPEPPLGLPHRWHVKPPSTAPATGYGSGRTPPAPHSLLSTTEHRTPTVTPAQFV